MPTRIIATALAFAIACYACPSARLARADDSPAAQREEAIKAQLRPICADAAARGKIVAQMIEQGGEYERATAKWDLDVKCEQVDLPVVPVHDTADPANDASHSDWIYDARWSPDGKLIATAGRDGSVRLWDVATGKAVRKIDINKLPALIKSDNPSYVRMARFLGDGRLLVVAADKQPVRIFDIESGAQVAEVPPTQNDVSSAPFIAGTASGLVILGGYGGEIVVYDTKTKSERYRLPADAEEYRRFAVSEAAGLLATAVRGKDRSTVIQLRKLETGALVWEETAKGSTSADSLAFSRDGQQLSAAVHGQAYIYATATKKLINTLLYYPTFGGSFEVAFTADGKKLITAQRHAQLWDIASGKRIRHFGPFRDLCHSVDVSPDGKYLVTGHMGSDGRIWDIETGTFFRRLGKNVHPPG